MWAVCFRETCIRLIQGVWKIHAKAWVDDFDG